MGRLSVKLLQVIGVHASMGAYVKGSKALTLVVTLEANGSALAVPATLCETFPAKEVLSSQKPAVMVGKEITLDAARFSARLIVALVPSTASPSSATPSLAEAVLSLEHCVCGRARRLKVNLYQSPANRLSEELPLSAAIAELTMELTALDFGDDAAVVDEANRTEQEQPLVERLRCYLTAYNPSELRTIDETVLRYRRLGWEAQLTAFLRQHGNAAEPVVGKVHVTVRGGKNFPKEGSSYVDPFVVVSLNGASGFGDSFHTPVVNNANEPHWNTTGTLRTLFGSNEVLQFRCFDYDALSDDDPIGEVTLLPLALAVRGRTMKRTLFVTKNVYFDPTTIDVEVTPLDFGLDPAVYETLAQSIEENELPRLQEYYLARFRERLPYLETDLAQHALTPGSFERYLESLIPAHGLEPRNSGVTVVLKSLQQAVHPRRHIPMDLSHMENAAESELHAPKATTTTTTAPAAAWHPVALVATLNQPQYVPRAADAGARLKVTQAQTQRVTFDQGEGSNAIMSTYCFFPQNDCVTLRLYFRERQHHHTYTPLGSVDLYLSKLWKGVPKTRTHALLIQEDTASPRITGYVTVTITAEHFGRSMASLQAAVELSALEEEREAAQLNRLRGMLRRYEPRELRRMDAIMSTVPDIDAYLLELEKKYGPPPGALQLELTIVGCRDLPRLEVTSGGLDPYVTVVTREASVATPVATVNVLNPDFSRETATFLLDVINPDRDTITVTVMDYDTNSEDDVVSSVVIPIRSLAVTTRTLRWLPLVATRGSANQVEGKVGIEFRSVGFGSPDEAVASEVSATIRPRVVAVLNRFAKHLLPQYETLLWKHGSDRFSRALDELIATHGPEPGTYRVIVQVKRCTNLPKIELTGGDPYVAVSCQGVTARTKEIPSELNPVWVDAVLDLDLPKPGALDSASVDVLVWDRDKNSSDDVWCRLMLPLSHYGGTDTNVTLPLIPEDLSKIRTPLSALSELPSITLSIRTVGFVGSKWGGQQERDADADRLRIIRHLLRHSKKDLGRYEVLRLDPSGIDAVLAPFGLETGQGLVQITVCSAELLKRKGNNVKQGKLYVTLRSTDDATLCLQTKTQTSTLPYKEGGAVQWSQSFTFDVAKRTTEFLLDVYEDVLGSDYCFGTVRISLARLQRGAIKRRSHPIIHHHESGEYAGRVSVSGYLTTEVVSSVLGRQEPYNEDEDIALLKRIRAMLLRYAPREIDSVDRISTPLGSTLDALIARYGPEPGTYRVQLTILACRDLPMVDAIGGIDPYVVIACGTAEAQQTKRVSSTQNPQFNETFLVDVVSTVNDDVVLTVMDYDRNSDDDEVCRVVIPLRSLSAQPVKRWLPLAPVSTDVPCRGSIGFEAQCIGFDPSQSLPENLKSVSEAEVESQRDRLVRMYIKYTQTIPYKYECELWAGTKLDDPIAKLIQRYGPEPGSRTVVLTLHNIEGLLDKDNRPVQKANLYVKMLCGDDELAETKPTAMAAAAAPASGGGLTSKFIFDTTMTVTVELPFDPSSANHHVVLRVMNDVVGFDEAFGEFTVSFRTQERGQPKRRVLPLVRIDRVEDPNATALQRLSPPQIGKVVGYVDLTTFSDRFGSATAAEVQEEAQFRQRVQALLQRYQHAKLRDLEAEVNSAFISRKKRDEYLAKLSTTIGVGPGTHKMRVAINGGPVLNANSDAPLPVVSPNAQVWEYSLHPHEPWASTTTIVQQTPTSFEVDLTNRDSERVIISCVLRNGGGGAATTTPSMVLLAAVPASLISADGSPTTRELTLLSPVKPPSPPLVDSIVGPFRTGTGDPLPLKVVGTLCVTVTDGGGSAVAGYQLVVNTPEQVALEDSYRARLWKLFSARCAARLLLVDGSILGYTSDQMECSMATWISQIGQEDGAVWIQVDVLSMSLLDSASTTSLYTKVHLNDVPITKALAAQVPHAGQGTRTDVRFPLTDDLHVKLATKGLLGTTVVGRAVLPVRLIREAAAATPGRDTGAESVDLCVWIFDDEKKKQVVGDVVVRIHHRGLPLQPPHVAAQPPGKLWISAYFRDYCLARRTVGYDSHALVEGMQCLNRLWETGHNFNQVEADVVYLHVVGCRGLPRMDTFGTSDTFVRVENTVLSTFRNAAQTTRVVSGTLDPNFYFHRDDAFAIFVKPGETAVEDIARKNELCLEVRDEDSASSEIIGKAFVLPAAIDSRWWDVALLESLEGPLDASARAAWISRNEDRLLRLPLVLHRDDGTSEGRGELLLCTSRRPKIIANNDSQTKPAPPPKSKGAVGKKSVATAAASVVTLPSPALLKRAYATTAATLRKNKMWNELEHLHSFVFRKVWSTADDQYCSNDSDVEWEEVIEIFLQDLKKEYGA